MARRLTTFLAACGLAVPVALAVPLTSAQAAPSNTGLTARNVAVCPTPQNVDTARCHAIRHEFVDANGKPVNPNVTPSGYGPSDLQSAYGLASASSTYGAGVTIAIVDAYDDPNAASDLATYRKQFGLPAMNTCTVSGGTVAGTSPCFVKVNQKGQVGPYPRANGGWAQEISLDLDMASAICPHCNILLVEASSASMTNLGAAVDTAASLGAVAISNSYGSSGDLSDASYGSYYNHPGVAVTASTGDNGYGVGYPATSDYTVAVGGTTLSQASNSRGWSETAWSGAGSGCSTYQSEPAWQSSYGLSACGSNRAIADVSADANPNTGVAVYDSYSYQGMSGWLVFGGTSVSSPIIASVYALAKGAGASWPAYPAALPYGDAAALYDVTGGSNGSCTPSVLCTGGPGWDGPTGLGTPSGLAAFDGSGGSGGSTTVSAPTSLLATPGDGSVSLTWTAPSGGPYTYDVYRGTNSGGESLLTTSPVSGTTYSDTTVANGTTYYYYVTAVASDGTQSSPSNEASATPTSTTIQTMSVGALTWTPARNGKSLSVTAPVTSTGNPVAGATVSVTITGTDGSSASGSGTTGSSGTVTFKLSRTTTGTKYTLTVKSVTANGYRWDGSQPGNASYTM